MVSLRENIPGNTSREQKEKVRQAFLSIRELALGGILDNKDGNKIKMVIQETSLDILRRVTYSPFSLCIFIVFVLIFLKHFHG